MLAMGGGPIFSAGTKMTDKIYINAQQLLEDSFMLGAKIIKSGFKPNFIIGIWRGGTPVGIAVQELLDYYGIKTNHISIRTSAYEGIEKRSREIQVHGLGYIVKNINSEDSLLIVDDVFDTGLSIKAVIDTIEERARKNTPHDIRVAVPFFKPTKNQTERTPDYYLHQTDKWLIFPHELDGLTFEEVKKNKPGLEVLLEGLPEP
jgi:hypoxanthine phosphoribosyltransferase